MARGRMSVQKRLRERKKAERNEFKREERANRASAEGRDSDVATEEDLEGYGLMPEPEETPLS